MKRQIGQEDPSSTSFAEERGRVNRILKRSKMLRDLVNSDYCEKIMFDGYDRFLIMGRNGSLAYDPAYTLVQTCGGEGFAVDLRTGVLMFKAWHDRDYGKFRSLLRRFERRSR